LVGGGEVDSFDAVEVRVADEGFDQFAAESDAAILRMNDDIPDGGAVNAVGGGACEADQAVSIPNGNHGMAVGNGDGQIFDLAIARPKCSNLEQGFEGVQVDLAFAIAEANMTAIHRAIHAQLTLE